MGAYASEPGVQPALIFPPAVQHPSKRAAGPVSSPKSAYISFTDLIREAAFDAAFHPDNFLPDLPAGMATAEQPGKA